MSRPNVFTIPADAPFLHTLVAALLDGRLVEAFDARAPFALADVTLYLPTRRAARAIRESFLDRTGGPVILPNIRTLGDVDEDEVTPDPQIPDLTPAVSAAERQLVLTQLVLGWSGQLARAAAGLPDEELLVPASPADAARLAAALGSLIDQVGADAEAWRGLLAQMPEELARYWEITLVFLEIATQAWPAHLAERGLIDPGVRRDRLVRREAARLAAHGSPSPVIAAGSTGSIPATAALLAAIARLPNGAVVLPGLDQSLEADSWAEIELSEREPAVAGHPQYGLKKLLESLGVGREDVRPLVEGHDGRNRFVSEAMRPAGSTERWCSAPALSAAEKRLALQGLAIVQAANEREEALAVATILREAAESPRRIAALVTPDRGLARRVAVELRRWGIEADDSAGRPLARTPPGVLARLVAEVALEGADPVKLLALLKHPLAGFGRRPAETHWAARRLEREVLRGPRLAPGLAALRHALEARLAERERSEGAAVPGGPSPPNSGVPELDSQMPKSDASEFGRGGELKPAPAADLLDGIQTALGSLEALARRRAPQPLTALIAAHAEALDAVLAGTGGRAAAGAEEESEALAVVFEELQAGAAFGPEVWPRDYPGLFSALIERAVVRRRGGMDPRIHIWGALEARLQSVDVVVLGGLNEGTWPGRTRLDPLLSRPMRAALDLEPPERRIGLAAHDFAQALGHPQVWITRADRQDGEPRVASRWLQRLTAYAGEVLASEMRVRGARVLALARNLDAPVQARRIERPRPSPPIARRPRKLSATQIETLIRDPYAIHARHVLRLRPLDAIGTLPEAAERGNLVHDVLERFVGERPRGPYDDATAERLLAIGREEFAQWSDFPEVQTLWWPRFERVARWFVRTEAARGEVERHVENTGSMMVGEDFELTARADRLDLFPDGTLAVIDYKTGTPPSNDEVLSLAPQLPLEALIAETGGFAAVGKRSVTALEYYQVSGRGEGGAVCTRGVRDRERNGKPALTLPQALAEAGQRLQEIVAYFAEPEAEYLSRKIPRRGRVFVGDYDHLARVAEWSVTGDLPDEVPG